MILNSFSNISHRLRKVVMIFRIGRSKNSWVLSTSFKNSFKKEQGIRNKLPRNNINAKVNRKTRWFRNFYNLKSWIKACFELKISFRKSIMRVIIRFLLNKPNVYNFLRIHSQMPKTCKLTLPNLRRSKEVCSKNLM